MVLTKALSTSGGAKQVSMSFEGTPLSTSDLTTWLVRKKSYWAWVMPRVAWASFIDLPL